MIKRITLIVMIAAALGVVGFWGWQFYQTRTHQTSSVKKQTPDIQTFSLSNGMEVILVPNHRVPAVSHTLWLRVGAADDALGKSGIAHYLEHLMFKGTPMVADGEYSKQIAALGGSFNAFTGADFTGYYVNIAKEHLEKVMQLESDRFQNLLPPMEVFEKERDVIVEERKSRTENRPQALLAEEVSASLFRHHPYRIPIIGWMHEMEGLTADDAKAFYDHYYHAGNLVLVVAGDITREQLQPLAEKYYGSMKAKEPYKRQWVKEPPQRAPRDIVFAHEQVRQIQWLRTYVAPSMVDGKTEHVLPLELLVQWLGGGKTSLLYRDLVVEKKLATSASAGYSGLNYGPSRLSIYVTPASGVTKQQIENAVDAILQKARTEPIDSKHLERAKTLLKASAIYARDGLEPVAQYIGYLRMLNLDVSYFTRWAQMVDAVTKEQITKAANDVLKPEQSVSAYMVPKAEVQDAQ